MYNFCIILKFEKKQLKKRKCPFYKTLFPLRYRKGLNYQSHTNFAPKRFNTLNKMYR